MGTNSRHIDVESLALSNPKEEGQTLDVCVFYDEGGSDYMSGHPSLRGYYLSVRPRTHANGMVKMDLCAGLKALIQPANRFSQKTLDDLAADVRSLAPYENLVTTVCRHTGLKLAETVA